MTTIRPVTVLGTAATCLLVSASALADPPSASASNVCEAPRAQRFALASLERVFAAPRLPLLRAGHSPKSTKTNSSAVSDVELEVRDSAPGHATKSERFTIPVTDGQVSELESRVEDVSYKIKIFRSNDRPLSFELWRNSRTPDAQKSEAKLSTAVRMKKGQKTVIARIDHADGKKTEVVATLR